MHLPSLKSVLLALALLGLVVPTGAAVTGATDDPFDDNGVVLAPYDGPNGEYASVGADGNLSVDVTDPGVNNNGRTVIRQVFVIENRGDRDARVWLTHDATDSVILYEALSSGVRTQSVIEQRAIQGAENDRTLTPGEQLVVSIAIDTRSEETSVGDRLLDEISLHARLPETSESTGGNETTGGPGVSEEPTGVEVEPIYPETVVSENGTDNGTESEPAESFTVEEMDPETIPDDPNPGSKPEPRAVITRADFSEQSAKQTERLRARGVDTLTVVGEEVTLDGTQSTINRTNGVDRERRIVKAVDIQAPPGQEDRPAIVRMEVSRQRLGSTDPSNARIGHLTEKGWELLRTNVVSTNEESVVLAAQTSGFSPFAVFSSPEVTYEWTLPDGTTKQGESCQCSFDEPGIYNVSLKITDALGSTDTTDYRILVNDEPEITIESPERVTANNSTTLRANVTDEVGNVTVTWDLPNGTQAEGRTVNYTFENGSYDVSATAEDEYGANATAETTITVGPAAAGGFGVLGIVSSRGVPVISWLVTASLLILVPLVVLRLWRYGLPSLPGWITAPARRRQGPRITAFEDPSWDTHRNEFEISTLRVEDPNGDLETVEISIRTARGTEVARQTVDFGRTDVYEASPVYIPGIPTVDVDPSRKYLVRIRAADTDDNEDTATSVLQFLPAFDTQFDRGVAAD
jgi:hypothetical protein